MKQSIALAAALTLFSGINHTLAQQSTRDSDQQAQVQQQDRGSKRQGGSKQQGGGSSLFRLLDIDRDGNLSAKEIDGAHKVLMKLDSNGDGTIDTQELATRNDSRLRSQGRTGGRGRDKTKRTTLPKPFERNMR